MSRSSETPRRSYWLLFALVLAPMLPGCSSCDARTKASDATPSQPQGLDVGANAESEIAQRIARKLADFSAIIKAEGDARAMLVTAVRLAEFSDENRLLAEDSESSSPHPDSSLEKRLGEAERQLNRLFQVAADGMLMFLGNRDHQRALGNSFFRGNADSGHLDNVLNEVARRLNQVPTALNTGDQLLEPIVHLGGGYRGVPWGADPSAVEKVFGKPIKRSRDGLTFKTNISTIQCKFEHGGLSGVEVNFSPPPPGIKRDSDEILDELKQKYGQPASSVVRDFLLPFSEAIWLDGDTRIAFSAIGEDINLFFASARAHRSRDLAAIRDRLAAMEEALQKQASDTASWKEQL